MSSDFIVPRIYKEDSGPIGGTSAHAHKVPPDGVFV